jgi:hypothetical protein
VKNQPAPPPSRLAPKFINHKGDEVIRRRRSSRGYFAGNHFVHVAPDPILSRFDGAHYGMGGLVKVFGGMFIFGRVAAADVAAHHAHAKVNPGVAHFDALFTDVRIGGRDLNLSQMFAFFGHSRLLQFSAGDAPMRSLCRSLFSPRRGFVTCQFLSAAYEAAEKALPPVEERSSAAEAGVIRQHYGTSGTRALPARA